MENISDIVFIPEGRIDSEEYFSGIPFFLYKALRESCQKARKNLHLVSFSECFDLEEIIKLYHGIRENDEINDAKLRKKINLWKNPLFVRRLKECRTEETLINLITEYWQATRKELLSRWPTQVSHSAPVLLLSPFYPFLGSGFNITFYLDCSNVNFFFDRNFGTLKHFETTENLIGFLRNVERDLLLRATKILTFSYAAAEELSTIHGIRKERFVKVGAGANLYEIPRYSIHERESPSNTLKVLFVGKDFERKGGNLILEIADALPKEHFTFTLITNFTGTNPQENVRILPQVGKADVQKHLKQSDAFIFPTRFEPFGIAVCEAMLYALPVVSSNVGALPEILVLGPERFLLNPDDKQGFIQALELLLRDIPFRQSCGKLNYESGIKNHTWNGVAENILQAMLS